MAKKKSPPKPTKAKPAASKPKPAPYKAKPALHKVKPAGSTPPKAAFLPTGGFHVMDQVTTNPPQPGANPTPTDPFAAAGTYDAGANATIVAVSIVVGQGGQATIVRPTPPITAAGDNWSASFPAAAFPGGAFPQGVPMVMIVQGTSLDGPFELLVPFTFTPPTVPPPPRIDFTSLVISATAATVNGAAALTGTDAASLATPTVNGAPVSAPMAFSFDGSQFSLTGLSTGNADSQIEIQPVDSTGVAVGSPFGFRLLVDATLPVVTVTTANNQVTNNIPPFTISGTVTGLAPLTLTVTDGTGNPSPVTVTGTNFGPYTPNMSEGTHTLTFVATDAAGNSSLSQTFTYTLNTTPPTVTFDPSTPSGLVTNGNPNPTVTGIASDVNGVASANATYEDGTQASNWSPPPAGAFSGAFTFTLVEASLIGTADGPHTVTVTATDTAGNVSTNPFQYTLDTSIPTVANSPGTISSTTPFFEITYSEAMNPVTAVATNYSFVDVNNAPIPILATPGASGNVVRFYPGAAHAASTGTAVPVPVKVSWPLGACTLTIGPGVTDLGGNQVTQDGTANVVTITVQNS